MASGNLSPRQKMINMMYLVLMALLALNVSSQILDSFHLMEVSFNEGKQSLEKKIEHQLVSIKDQANNDPTLKPYDVRANEAASLTNKFVDYIEDIKTVLIEKSGGRKKTDDGKEGDYTSKIMSADKMEDHAAYFFKDIKDSDPEHRSKELEAKINTLREDLLKLLDSDTANGISISSAVKAEIEGATNLNTHLSPKDLKKYKLWARKYFDHSPVAAVITMLTKVQSDARNTQTLVTAELSKGKVSIITIEELIPVVKTNKDVIMAGEKHSAEIFLAARTAGSENNIITLNGKQIENKGGKGYYEVTGSSPGTYTYKGVITVKTKEGDKTYNFDKEYQVFAGGASISPTEMNMLYIGVKNPISVSVAGANPADVIVNISGGGGRISKVKGSSYTCNVSAQGKAIITASVKTANGIRKMGSMEFRVRKLPKPNAMFGGNENGATIPAQTIQVVSSIRASMGKEFAFGGIKYAVTSYTLFYIARGKPPIQKRVNGNRLDPGIKGKLQRAKRGDKIIIDNIKARGPTGVIGLKPVMITIR